MLSKLLRSHWEFFFLGSFSGLFHFLMFNVNALLCYASLYSLIHIWLLSLSMAVISIAINLIKLRQLSLMLGPRIFHFGRTYIRRFKIAFVQTLQSVLLSNRTYGVLLLIFLLTNCPMNVWMIMWLLFGQWSGMDVFFVVTLTAGQVFGMFGLHLLMTLYSSAIHWPGRLLIRQSVQKQCMVGDLRARLCLAYCIEVVHTRNRYGFTYGKFGLVTLSTFAKVSIICTELLAVC